MTPCGQAFAHSPQPVQIDGIDDGEARCDADRAEGAGRRAGAEADAALLAALGPAVQLDGRRAAVVEPVIGEFRHGDAADGRRIGRPRGARARASPGLSRGRSGGAVSSRSPPGRQSAGSAPLESIAAA